MGKLAADKGDLVERLEAHMGNAYIGDVLPDCREAAQEIRVLRAQLASARKAAIEEVIATIEPFTRGAFTGWRGKTGDSKITLDQAENHFTLCIADMMDNARALNSQSKGAE